MTLQDGTPTPQPLPVIAVDGPAASGKGEISRRLAARLGYGYLDTGLLYRAVGANLIAQGLEARDQAIDEAAALKAARRLHSDQLDDPALRGDAAAQAASKVSAIPAVREALLAFQRDFARAPGADKRGAILDGRDIGTVVCPQAPVKLFVEADVETRAKRRYEELRRRGMATTLEAVLADLQARDERDRTRPVAPLAPAPDAHVLDTTGLKPEEAYGKAYQIVLQAGLG